MENGSNISDDIYKLFASRKTQKYSVNCDHPTVIFGKAFVI